MATRYLEPLGAAYERMKTALFRPFDLEKWIVVGFASWIAGWSLGGGFNFNYRFPTGGNRDADASFNEVMGSIPDQLSGFWADPMWRFGLIAAALAVLALGILIVWINSRAEFVFLDQVLHGRRKIVDPWRTWRAQGQSLFVWRLVFGLIMVSAFAIVSGAIFLLASAGRIPRSASEFPWQWFLIGLGIAWLPFAIAGLYVHVFLRHFVTPVMFRDRSTTTEAWSTFWPIFRERFGTFLLYGLFLLVVHIGLFLALIPAIVLTCCLLGCLLVIPFVGAVVWLPVSYSFRAFGPEFLAQFGPDYDVWPKPVPAPEAPPDTAT